jgi:hypothetical protein
MLADRTKNNLTPETLVQDDCAYVMERFRRGTEEAGRMILIVTCGGLVVAMLSVFANLGVIDLSVIKYGDVVIVLKKLFFVRLFLTSVSLGCAIAVLNYIAISNYYVTIYHFLAKEKKYGKAMLMLEFREWAGSAEKRSQHSTVVIVLVSMIAGLLVVLPLVTFMFSIFGG